MAQLYTVHFTTRKPIKKYDSKGKVIAESMGHTPITHTALPYATAMSYSGADNFKIEPYVMDDRRTAKGTGRDNSIGNGTRPTTGTVRKEPVGPRLTSGSTTRSNISNAAATGNLGAALNV